MRPTAASELPLSDKERALWLLHRLVPDKAICNTGSALRVNADVRPEALQRAVDCVTARHPGLRSVVVTTGQETRRRVLPTGDFRVVVEVVETEDVDLGQYTSDAFTVPFDIEREPLMRVRLVRSPRVSVVCLVFHHLVVDGESVLVVIRNLIELYESFLAGTDVPENLRGVVPVYLPEPVDGPSLAYWTETCATVDPAAQRLPAGRPMPNLPTFAGARVDHVLSAEAISAVVLLRRRTHTTDNIVLLAAYYVLLARHGAGPDLVVGVPTSGRTIDHSGELVGYHANTLPTRVTVDLDDTFDALVRRVRKAFMDGLSRAHVPFESVQKALAPATFDWRAPLFRFLFNFLKVELGAVTMGGSAVELADWDNGLTRLDLELSVYDEVDTKKLTAEYSTESFDRPVVTAMLARFERLVTSLAEHPEQPLADADLDTPDDRALAALAVGPRDTLPDGTVLDLVVGQARRTPDALAVGDWTYDRLLSVAGAVHHELVRHGVAVDDVVGVSADRGPLLAAAVLGTWSAGAAYLPLDTSHPVARRDVVIENAGVRFVLADRTFPTATSTSTLRLDRLASARDPVERRRGILAYVIYTSGSTGQPKGVDISHRGLLNSVRHLMAHLGFGDRDVVLWTTTFTFDASAIELLPSLCTGARLVPVSDADRLRPDALLRVREAEGATVWNATPSEWRRLEPRLPASLPGMRLVTGGEPLDAALAERLLSRGCRLFFGYGPTEATILASLGELRSPVARHVPIGTAIANTTLHLLDGNGRPVPPGVPGELCVAGPGVAVGYRGDPPRGRDSFVEDGTLGRYYRTGDRARQRPDGQFEFLGRTDRQVKVRGQRVELAEVEAALERHSAVAVATVWMEPHPAGGERLAAAVLLEDRAREEQVTPVELLLAHAADWLPAAWVPGRLTVVPELPRTATGKVDHARLAAQVEDGAGAALPDDPILRTLVRLWREVLVDDTVTAESNFFLVGGHSVLAIELAARISAELGRDVGFEAVFRAPTPGQLAAVLR